MTRWSKALVIDDIIKAENVTHIKNYRITSDCDGTFSFGFQMNHYGYLKNFVQKPSKDKYFV